jgi:hypothetical protein
MINKGFNRRIGDLCKQVLKNRYMYRESEKNIELEKKILELKAELKIEQEKAEILNKMLELAKINPSGLANLIDDLPAKD